MSITLYFAEEIPLEPKDAQGLSDSAPLLNGSRDDAHALNEPNNERFPNGHVDGNNVSNVYQRWTLYVFRAHCRSL